MSTWRRIAWRSWAQAPWLPVDGAPLRLGEALELLHHDVAGHEWQHAEGDGGTYLEWRPVSATVEPAAQEIPPVAAGSPMTDPTTRRD